jgi:hypothetical protein
MTNHVDLGTLAQKWVHSHEEDSNGEMVFRPATYPFPPSRGRKSFDLRPRGHLGTSGIGPDDRPVQGEGAWNVDASNRLTLEPSTPGAPRAVMQILQVAPDKLVVRKE